VEAEGASDFGRQGSSARNVATEERKLKEEKRYAKEHPGGERGLSASKSQGETG